MYLLLDLIYMQTYTGFFFLSWLSMITISWCHYFWKHEGYCDEKGVRRIMVGREFRKTVDVTYGFEGHCKELGIYSKYKAKH